MSGKVKIFKSFKARMIVTFAVLLIIILSVASYRSYKLLLKNIEQKVFVDQQKILISTSEKINSLISTNVDIAKNISLIFSNFENIPEDFRRDFFSENIKTIINENADIYGLWTIFKPYSVDQLDNMYANETNNLTGQFSVTYYRENGRVKLKEVDLNDFNKLDEYLQKFNKDNILILAPQKDTYWELNGLSYIVRIVVPVVHNNKIIGLVGLDINYLTLKYIFNNTKYQEIIIDDNLNIIYIDNFKNVDRNLVEIFPFVSTNKELQQSIVLKKQLSNKGPLFDPNETSFYSLYSLPFKNIATHWSIIFSISNNELIKNTQKRAVAVFLSPLIVFIILMLFFIIFINKINKYLNEISNSFNEIYNQDQENKSLKFSSIKEVQFILNEINLKKEDYNNLVNFTDIILKEKFDQKIEFKTTDALTDNLIKLKNKLIEEYKERDLQQKKQDAENRVSNALAEINNIQRLYNNNLTELAYNTIKFIADFINAIQAGFYVVNRDNETPVLNLKSFYSYNRRIYSKKQIELDDGLAGTCALEQKTIYSKIPKNYLEITSGLGKEPPNFIFLIPLVNNDTTMGVLEFAFLHDLPNYLKEFLKASSTVIASSIASSENNSRTLKLLEETRSITKEMQQKEEQMNDQITELENLKIKSEITELDRSAILNTINKIVYFAEFDQKTNVLSINKNLSEKLQIQTSDAKMLSYFDVLMITDNEKHHKYWNEVLDGKTVEFDLPIFQGKFNFWFECILSPVFNEQKNIYKIIFFAIEITEIKQKEEDVKKLVAQMNEKAEQIEVQEMEMNEFFEEYQKIQEQVEELEKKITELNEEKVKTDNSFEFLQKEFKKRTNRSKRIELNLKKKIRALEEELNKLKNQ